MTERHRAIYERYDDRCGYCGHHLDTPRADGKSGRRCVDHIVPDRTDGRNSPKNLMPSCWNCNSIKHARPLDFLRRYRGLQKAGLAEIVSLAQYDELVNVGVPMPPLPIYEFHFEGRAP